MQTNADLLNPKDLFCCFKKCDKIACDKTRQKLQLSVKPGLTGLISCSETHECAPRFRVEYSHFVWSHDLSV